mgnify:CR=1 FL=1
MRRRRKTKDRPNPHKDKFVPPICVLPPGVDRKETIRLEKGMFRIIYLEPIPPPAPPVVKTSYRPAKPAEGFFDVLNVEGYQPALNLKKTFRKAEQCCLKFFHEKFGLVSIGLCGVLDLSQCPKISGLTADDKQRLLRATVPEFVYVFRRMAIFYLREETIKSWNEAISKFSFPLPAVADEDESLADKEAPDQASYGFRVAAG